MWKQVSEDFWAKNRESKVDQVNDTVKGIVDMVREQGDKALIQRAACGNRPVGQRRKAGGRKGRAREEGTGQHGEKSSSVLRRGRSGPAPARWAGQGA